MQRFALWVCIVKLVLGMLIFFSGPALTEKENEQRAIAYCGIACTLMSAGWAVAYLFYPREEESF